MKLQMKKVVAGLLCCTCSITTVLSDFTIANAMQKATGLSSDHQLAMKQMSKKVVSAMEVVSDYVEKESLDEQVILSTKPLQSVKTAGDFIMSGSTLVKYQGNAAAVVIPENVTEIGYEAFKDCITLQEISFPSRLRSIDYGAFMGCVNLKKVDLPDCLRYLGSNADSGVFEDCISLEDITLSDNLKVLGAKTFYGCTALTDIVIPKTLEEAHPYIFTNSDVQTVTLEEGMPKVPGFLFCGFATLESIVLPESITEIELSAFTDCINLQTITLPKNLNAIGENAFHNCNSLEKVVLPDNINEISYFSFDDVELWAMPNTITEASLLREGIPHHVYDVPIPVDSIQLNTTDKTMISGTTYDLFATIAPSNATNKELIWTSSNTAVVTVSASGRVTARGNGTAIITATAKDGSKKAAKCTITVKTPVSSLKLNVRSKTLNRGNTYTLKASIYPSTASNKSITWSSSNTKVAKVDSKGKVTAVNGGSAIITAKASNGMVYKCNVYVRYKITYYLNGGKNDSKNPSVYYNQNITLKNPTRKGYSFVGWYSDSACRKKYPKVTTKSKGDIKRYAKWAKISVGKASTPSLTNLKGKKMQVKLRKVAQASGYQITYTTDKRFKSNVKSTYTSALTKTLTALKTKKTYYVKVRAYKYDSTKAKVYGSYSSVKAIRIKK